MTMMTVRAVRGTRAMTKTMRRVGAGMRSMTMTMRLDEAAASRIAAA